MCVGCRAPAYIVGFGGFTFLPIFDLDQVISSKDGLASVPWGKVVLSEIGVNWDMNFSILLPVGLNAGLTGVTPL